MNNFTFIDEELEFLTKSDLKRELKTVITAGGPWIELSGGKEFYNSAQIII